MSTAVYLVRSRSMPRTPIVYFGTAVGIVAWRPIGVVEDKGGRGLINVVFEGRWGLLIVRPAWRVMLVVSNVDRPEMCQSIFTEVGGLGLLFGRGMLRFRAPAYQWVRRFSTDGMCATVPTGNGRPLLSGCHEVQLI